MHKISGTPRKLIWKLLVLIPSPTKWFMLIQWNISSVNSLNALSGGKVTEAEEAGSSRTYLLLGRAHLLHRSLKALACHREINSIELSPGLLCLPFLFFWASSVAWNVWTVSSCPGGKNIALHPLIFLNEVISSLEVCLYWLMNLYSAFCFTLFCFSMFLIYLF